MNNISVDRNIARLNFGTFVFDFHSTRLYIVCTGLDSEPRLHFSTMVGIDSWITFHRNDFGKVYKTISSISGTEYYGQK